MRFRLPYALLWTALLPLALLRLVWRGRRQPAYLRDLGERLGHYPARPDSRPVIWLHAVSVGETRAAQPLLQALRARWPEARIVLTAMTPTGRETGRALYGDDEQVTQAYLPYDHPWLVARFLQHFTPCLGVVMETELWPGLLDACARQSVPVVLANARLSARSARRYARFPALTRRTLCKLSAIACQTTEDAERLQALGAEHLSVTGNIKFDNTPPASQRELARQFRAWIGQRRCVLLASSREGEEALLVDALRTQARDDVLWVVVPRHPQRFDDVAQLCSAAGLTLQRRSEAQALHADTRVWLGDSMGEMFAYYAAAEVALVGGSWKPLGGQNLIESCAVGTPVIVGPHTFNFAQVAEQAIACGAAKRADDLAAGMALALHWLEDEPARAEAARAATRFAQQHAGATQRTLALIEGMLNETGRGSQTLEG